MERVAYEAPTTADTRATPPNVVSIGKPPWSNTPTAASLSA